MRIISTSPLSLLNLPIDTVIDSPTFTEFIAPVENLLPRITPLQSASNRPLTFTFHFQLRSLIYYHVEECTSARHLLQMIQSDPLTQQLLMPPTGLGKSTFYEANANRGLQQMLQLFDKLAKKVSRKLGIKHSQLGDLVAVDGSLIDATLSMAWADYTSSTNKAKVHLGFDLNRGIPLKIHLTAGKVAERPFVISILRPGETGVLDRGYQDHQRFDEWIQEGKHFVARLKKNTKWQVKKHLPFDKGAQIFFFAEVMLGDKYHSMTYPVYLVGFRCWRKVYWVVTSRSDLSASEIAFIYSLRWEIECLFGWWKRHLKVYHLISRNPHGTLLQLLAGLITYLLLVLYCYRVYGDGKPSILRVRQLRWRIRQDAREIFSFINIGITVDAISILLLFHLHAIF